VIVFPQATRSFVFDPSYFNTLGVKLAAKARVPVAPIALKTDFQGYSVLFKDLGTIDTDRTIYIRFGPLLKVLGKGQQTHDEVVRFIARNLRQWGGQVRGVPIE
jgi:1-acyl-sn-glycerol-3-phosphate acyltransferase